MNIITAHAELNEEQSQQFLYIKKRFGAKNNSEVVRRLIQEKYDALIQTVPHGVLRRALEENKDESDPGPD